MSELQPCPICKSTRICIDGGDNTYHPRCLDCGCTAPFDAWQSRTPSPPAIDNDEPYCVKPLDEEEKAWSVFYGDDMQAVDIEWADREDAEETAQIMNYAYSVGKAAVTAPPVAEVERQ